MTFKRLILIFLSSIILMTLSFCKKPSDGCNKEIAYYALSDSVLMINPYPTDDVLVFRTDNDSVSIKFNKRFKTTRRDSPGFMIIKGCPPDYTTTEVDNTEFSSGSMTFKIDLAAPDYIFINLNLTGVNIHAFFSGLYRCKKDSIYEDTIHSGDSIVAFYPEIILGGKTHKRVYELYPVYESMVDEYWKTNVYYSIEDGLVGFKNLYGLWYLE